MLWRGGRRSTNIEDRRGMRPVIVGGGLGGIILLLISLYFGIDPSVVYRDTGVEATGPATSSPADEETKDFVSTVVGFTEDTWSQLFRQAGGTYRPPKLVLFTGAI